VGPVAISNRAVPPVPTARRGLSVFSLHATVPAMPPSKVLIALTCVVAAACNYQKPRPSLAKPERGAQATEPANPPPAAPAKTLRYAFVTMGRPAGGAELSIAADGTRTSHFAFNDRGRGPDLTTTIKVDERGWPTSAHSTGVNYWKAPVEETVALTQGSISWTSTGESGSAPAERGYFAPVLGPFDSSAMLARALARAPNQRLALLPAGEAWIDDETTLEVEVGGARRTLRRLALAGFGFAPELLWVDADGELFASVSSWSSLIVAGAEPLIARLLEEDERWRQDRAGKLAAELTQKPPAAGLAITNARLFDSEKKQVREGITVVLVGDKITAVGGRTTKIPAGAQVIDAAGRMLIPGLWDMHVHLGDGDGLLDLAMGVTSVRDLGNTPAVLDPRVARFDAGTELGPRVLRAGLIDGPGELAAPTGAIAATAEEGIAHVDRFAKLGYQQIKLYSSLDPKLVPILARAAHARGLRVSGHIPQGMIASQAVEAGYDEIQHANMLFLNFLLKPGDDTRGPARFKVVAELGSTLDLTSRPVADFLALLLRKKTVLDPTVATFEAMFTSEPKDPDAALSPYFGRLPAQIERGARGGGLEATPEQREIYRASHAAMGKLVKLAWERGVPIVAGTDSYAGLTLARELELYVAAGIPPADVLSIATIGAARVMNRQKELGSISVGKRADLVLLDGDPTKQIGDVRNASLVVSRGNLFDPARLFSAVGMQPRK
jgi:imidazolonepropionase-like amidohydrolase